MQVEARRERKCVRALRSGGHAAAACPHQVSEDVLRTMAKGEHEPPPVAEPVARPRSEPHGGGAEREPPRHVDERPASAPPAPASHEARAYPSFPDTIGRERGRLSWEEMEYQVPAPCEQRGPRAMQRSLPAPRARSDGTCRRC